MAAAYAVGQKSSDFFVRNKEAEQEKRAKKEMKVLLSSYKQVSCPEDGITIATFGQSNSANTVIPLSNKEIPKNLFQYDWKKGNVMNTKNLF